MTQQVHEDVKMVQCRDEHTGELQRNSNCVIITSSRGSEDKNHEKP